MKKNLWKMLLLALTFCIFPLHVSAEDCIEHTWSEWEITDFPTCSEPGEQSRECLDCQVSESEVIPATGEHDWDDWEITKNATIKKTGTAERYCMECDTVQTKSIQKLTPFVKLSPKTLSLKVAQTKKLSPSYARGDSVKRWKSSNKKVVSVSTSGKVTAKKKGSAKITVTMKSGKQAVCTVKVSSSKKTSSSGSSGGLVYWTPNGKVYHKTKNCPTLKRSRTICSGSKSPKPRKCKVCY